MIKSTSDKIKAQIKLHGLTTKEVANRLGVLPTNLSRTILNPRITLMDMERIANAIGCNVEDFFTDYSIPTLTCPHCGQPIRVELTKIPKLSKID